MSSRNRRFPVRRGRPASVTLLVLALLASGASPGTTHAAAPDPVPVRLAIPSTDVADRGEDGEPAPATAASDAIADVGGLQPSIQYVEALAHEHDRIAFTPGARVAVPFTPRAGDRWSVGGAVPTGLPSGRLDGRAMRTEPPGHSDGPTRPLPDRSIDLPNEMGRGIRSISASYVPEAATGTVTTQATVTRTGLRREIFGFLPYWELNATSLRLDYKRISTIAYFGIGADAAGNLQRRNPDGSTSVGWSGWTSSKLTGIISAAHKAHTRVVLTVQSFGWNSSGLARQRSLLGSPTARANLARQIAAAVRDRGADGVNLDFEPLARGYDTEFTALVRGIRSQLNRIHPGYQITFDTTGSIGNYPIEAATAAGGADAIFIMGYDYRTSGSSPVGSIAPLNRDGYDIRDTIAAYTARVPASKLILGVPYYGRAWSTPSNVPNASNTSSAKTGPSTTVTYDTAADYLAQYGRKFDATEGVAWTAYRRQNCTATYGCVTSWRQLYVDDAAAIGRKYDLVNAYNLRGAGIWALGYDGTRPQLWNAIQAKFITDSTPPTVGIRTLPVRSVNPGIPVAWTGTDDVAIASYDTQVSTDGGAWATWLTATKAGSAVWPGVDGHVYAFRVRARDLSGNRSAWNVVSTAGQAGPALAVGGFGVVRLDRVGVRSAPDASAARIARVSSGALLAIVGGPKTADGFTWYQVVGPLTEWTALRPVIRGGWIAARSGGQVVVAPAKAPNATRIDAYLGHLTFNGTGGASVGSSASAVGQRAFSPNGDRSRDAIRIDWTNAVSLDRLVLRVFRANGSLVGEVPVAQRSKGAQTTTWNGSVGGHRLIDGRYLVSLIGRKGATTYYNPASTFRPASLGAYGVTIDRVAPTVKAASATGSLISPNGDKVLDSVKVSLSAGGATVWAFGVAPVLGTRTGRPILIRSGSGSAASVTWSGQTSAGTIAPDGTYRLQLLVGDPAGNRVSRSWTVRLDRTPPAIVATAPASFSPNGDGVADTARLAWSTPEAITGTARIYHGSTLIRSWSITRAAAGAVTWTGTSTSGSRVADGSYTIRVSGRDAAGNVAARSVAIKVDRTLASVRWTPAAFFVQDGDAFAPTATVTFKQSRTAKVSAAIYAGPTLVRTIWTNRSLGAGTHAWTWDGRNAVGGIAPRGTYTVRITAVSAIGTSVLSRSILLDAFAVGLSAATVTAGQTLTITLSPTEPLKAAPTVTFTQRGRAPVTKAAASIGGGRYRVSFTVATKGVGTATIAISGRDVRGGLNTTSRTVAVR